MIRYLPPEERRKEHLRNIEKAQRMIAINQAAIRMSKAAIAELDTYHKPESEKNMAFDANWVGGHTTRDGRKARILATDIANENYPLCAIVTNKNTAKEAVYSYNKNGRYASDHTEHPLDLVNVPLVLPTIPWESIQEKWKYAAMDEDGMWYFYEGKPHIRLKLWFYKDDAETFFNATKLVNFTFPTEHWEHTLIKRPEA